MTAHLQDLLETMACALVDGPERVRVTAQRQDGETLYTVYVGEGDAGQVIGKQGRIANAIRTLVKAAARRSKRRVRVEFAA